MFRFLRYDVRLEKDWLARELNYKVSDDASSGCAAWTIPPPSMSSTRSAAWRPRNKSNWST